MVFYNCGLLFFHRKLFLLLFVLPFVLAVYDEGSTRPKEGMHNF